MRTYPGQQAIQIWLLGAAVLLGLSWWSPSWIAPLLIGSAALIAALEITRNLYSSQSWPLRWVVSGGCIVFASANGVFWLRFPLPAIGVMVILAVAVAVSQRHRRTATDRLTGLLHPAVFAARAEEELSRGLRFGRPAAVAVVTFEQAVAIRQTDGRRAAQAAIKRVAESLSAQSRSYDLLTRLDSTRFAILLPETTYDEALAVAWRVHAAVGMPYFRMTSSTSLFPLSVSIGLSMHPQDGDTMQQLLSSATASTTVATTTGPIGFAPDQPTTVAEVSTRGNIEGAQQRAATPSRHLPRWIFLAYVGLLSIGAGVLFVATFRPIPQSAWGMVIALGVVGIAALQLRFEIFGRGGASTGIVPIIAGGVLFGPTVAIVLGVFVGLSTWRRGGPFYRPIFNASLFGIVAGTLVLCQPFLNRLLPDDGLFHLALVGHGLILGLLCYVLNSTLAVGAMVFSEGGNPLALWREHLGWLLPHTLICGVLAAFMAFAGSGLGPIGPLIFAIPALMLQVVTKQYTDRTRESVIALREAHTELAATNGELLKSVEALEYSYTATLSAFSGMLDARDSETEGHSQRVVAYAVAIGRELRLDQADMAALEVGALLHDIGKVGVADAILRKNGPLTAEEWIEMRRHPEIGWALAARIPFLHNASLLVRHHHERWDGKGYPDQLRGEDIPLIARVFAVADSFDAMISDRPYRLGLPLGDAISELQRGAGSQFDPQVIEAFLQLGSIPGRLEEIRQPRADSPQDLDKSPLSPLAHRLILTE